MNDKNHRESIMSVDGVEKIFKENLEEKIQEIEFLRLEIDSILSDLSNENLLIG
ncbi:MAG TPA: hypothetical protein VF677_06520 [Flavobacterium sp.]